MAMNFTRMRKGDNEKRRQATFLRGGMMSEKTQSRWERLKK
jgi:hypothetical protein